MGWGGVGAFENRRSLIHFVKHGHVDHPGPAGFGLHELFPEEFPAESGDLRFGPFGRRWI